MAAAPGAARIAPPARGFTLTELLTVVGLIALIVSLFLPVLAKVRAASDATNCLSNLRQMGTAWTMYTAEHRWHLPFYTYHTPLTPDRAWHGYWLGALDGHGVKGDAILCPAAREPIPSGESNGYGSATYAWTGKYGPNGSVVSFDTSKYRSGSYGYNQYLTAGSGFGEKGTASMVTAVRGPSDVPLFVDCVYIDVAPVNGSPDAPMTLPTTLSGAGLRPESPSHWKFTLARHGRGVNVGMADGSARWVAAEETYTLTWHRDWLKYRLRPAVRETGGQGTAGQGGAP